jgi:hypothetical protein
MATPETPVIVTGMEGPRGDTVSATVQGAVDASLAHYTAHQGDTYGQGTTIGTTPNLPPVISDHSKHTGSASATESGPAG